MRILAVDDEPVFLDLLEGALQEIGGHQVKFAQSGSDALRIIRETIKPFDCFLLDIEMPGMDGIELCRRIRQLSPTRRTPILMLTAMTGKEFVDQAFTAGAIDYINKPLDTLEVKARLGVIQRLVDETHNRRFLEQSARKSGAVRVSQVAFDDPVFLEEVAGMIEFLAMENYVLKLGKMRLFNHIAVGFHVRNAQEIYARSPSQEFVEVITDVAEIIYESLKERTVLFSYVGRGDFVCLLPRYPGIARTELELELRMSFEALEPAYLDIGQILPSIQVGKPVSVSLVQFDPPNQLLTRAIEAAQNPSHTPIWARKKFRFAS